MGPWSVNQSWTSTNQIWINQQHTSCIMAASKPVVDSMCIDPWSQGTMTHNQSTSQSPSWLALRISRMYPLYHGPISSQNHIGSKNVTLMKNILVNSYQSLTNLSCVFKLNAFKKQLLMDLLLITVLIDLIRLSICVFIPGSSPNPRWSAPHPTGTY